MPAASVRDRKVADGAMVGGSGLPTIPEDSSDITCKAADAAGSITSNPGKIDYLTEWSPSPLDGGALASATSIVHEESTDLPVPTGAPIASTPETNSVATSTKKVVPVDISSDSEDGVSSLGVARSTSSSTPFIQELDATKRRKTTSASVLESDATFGEPIGTVKAAAAQMESEAACVPPTIAHPAHSVGSTSKWVRQDQAPDDAVITRFPNKLTIREGLAIFVPI